MMATAPWFSNNKSPKKSPQSPKIQQTYHKQNDYSVHYENNLTKITIKKIQNTEKKVKNYDKDICTNIGKNEMNGNNKNIMDGNAVTELHDCKTSEKLLETKRRRSGNLNSSNEESSPKVRQEKKRSKNDEKKQRIFDVSFVLRVYTLSKCL